MEEPRTYAVGSALVYRGNKIAFKERKEGLSLLGGFLHWNGGRIFRMFKTEHNNKKWS